MLLAAVREEKERGVRVVVGAEGERKVMFERPRAEGCRDCEWMAA